MTVQDDAGGAGFCAVSVCVVCDDLPGRTLTFFTTTLRNTMPDLQRGLGPE